MKKKLIFLVLCCIALSIQAQKMNTIKTNATAYAFRNINLSYERAINRWFSVNVGFGTVPDGKVPFMSTFVNAEDELRDIKVGLTNITIEPRFYLGKGFGKGVYIAPYYRNSSFKAADFTYYMSYNNGVTTTEIPLKISGKANGNSGGIMFGSQFSLNKKQNFIMDLWIIGAHYGTSKGDFTATSNRVLTADEQQQIKSELEGLDIPMVQYTVQTNANGATIKMDGPWAGLRSGISLGYRF